MALRDDLRRLVERSTAIMGAVGLFALVSYSLNLGEFGDLRLENLPTLVAKLRDFDQVKLFLAPRLPAIALIAVTIIWYFSYRNAVLNELDLIAATFPENRAPLDFRKLLGRRMFGPIGYAIVIAYVVLIWAAANNIELYCMAALCLHAADLVGSSLSLQNIARTYAEFRVPSNAPAADFMTQRRQILIDYYFNNPTLVRICAIFLVTAASLMVAVNVRGAAGGALTYAPYVLMTLNILCGEIVIWRWRRRRNVALHDIDDKEHEYRRTLA